MLCSLCCVSGQASTPLRRRAERKEKDALQEKRTQLQPAVAKEVQTFLNAKRKEARGMVLGRWGVGMGVGGEGGGRVVVAGPLVLVHSLSLAM